jgi:hypothetical protein
MEKSGKRISAIKMKKHAPQNEACLTRPIPAYDSSWHHGTTTMLRCQQQYGKIISEINRLQRYS